MELRRLMISDLKSYVENRLRALEHDHAAFLTTLEEERSRGTTHFESTLSYEGDEKVIFGAISEDSVVGTIGVSREERSKIRHKAMLWGMYVDVSFRKQGIGGALLDLAICHAMEKMKVTVVMASVESNNGAAKALYESRGFKCWGTEPKAMHSTDRYFDEDHMIRYLPDISDRQRQLERLQ